MTGAATRYLYLARHGEATPDESGLTDTGRRQATLLGRRLRDVPLTSFHHGPLPRAEQTARLVADELTGITPRACEAAGDYVPHIPERSELPDESADFYLRFLADVDDEEREHGAELARRALRRYTGAVTDGTEDRHDLVVTHSFLIGWLVRDAMHAPKWRWLGLNHGNAALTVIRYAPGRAASVLLSNDMRHLPGGLRWTGFPPEVHV